MKFLFLILSLLYGLLVYLRNIFFDFKIIRQHSFNIPIISVGNLALGGTGKTPMTIFLSIWLSKHKISHVIVSRGYKKMKGGVFVVNTKKHSPQECGDEPFVMAKKLIKTPIIVGNKKYKSINLAIKTFSPSVILLDDGFQSRSINRDLDIVLINSLDCKQSSRLVPLGNFRENLSALQRADLVVFTKNNLMDKQNISNEHRKVIIKQLGQDNIPYLFSNIISNLLIYNIDSSSMQESTSSCIATPSLGLCGIGNPESFNKLMKLYFNNIVHIEHYTDHYDYHQNNLTLMNIIKGHYKKDKLKNVVITYKDFIKISGLSFNVFSWIEQHKISLYVIDINIELKDKNNLLINCLQKMVA